MASSRAPTRSPEGICRRLLSWHNLVSTGPVSVWSGSLGQSDPPAANAPQCPSGHTLSLKIERSEGGTYHEDQKFSTIPAKF